MSDVITKFRLETTQFDSKLRDTAKGLYEIANTAKAAGKDFNGFSQKSIEAARALGTVASGATNTKDKLRDLVGSYNDAVKAYDLLSDKAKQDEFGKAMAASLQKLQQDIKETKQELYGLGDSASKMSGGLFSDDKISGMLQVFGGNMMTKAAGWAASFASELGDMVKQGIDLAKQGEGVRIAFQRLGRGDILDGLRQATHGTVNDLELMKAAVKFNDFKLPLDELGTMLAFAQQKAKDTGQSVDYMVDSIVTGLGRKSLMILDNLGLSAAQIKEKMAETGDMTKAVGEIIREEMEKAGDYVETAADRATQANVSLQNKMEELGRKFAPLQEASDNFWTSMKIGILDVVGGPLSTLINGLTEAGRLMNAYNKNNKYPGGDGQQTRTQKYIQNLQNSSNRESLYNRQLESINRVINSLDKQSKDKQKLIDNSSNTDYIAAQTELKKRIDIQMQSWMQIREEYKAGAKNLLTPVKPVIDTSEAEQSVASLTKKLKELQTERQKAIKAGDTQRSKDLLKQINQTKADIKGLNPTSLKTSGSGTHKQTDAEKASALVANAERTYAETLEKSAIRMQVGLDSSLEGKKKELAAQERLFDAYNDAYATYKDPKYKEAASGAADKIKSLAGEVKSMEDAVKTSKVKWVQGLSGFNAQTMGAWMQGRQKDLSKAEYGSADYTSIVANIADMNTIKTVLEQSLKAGIDAAQFDLEPLWEKVFDGENIDDSTWQSMVDVINEKLKEMNIEPIKIDFNTGGLSTEGKKAEKSWQSAAVAVSAVGSAIQNIEDPAAKVVGTVAQAIATVALSFAQAMAKTSGPWEWVAFAATGLATMISTISAIHSATGYANGGIVGGNSFSGDNVYGGPDAMVNSGELILNKAQQNVVAQELQGGSRMIQVHGVLRGKDIFIAAENWSKSAGKGEFVTW
jgi:hypothetical protein